jgi:hypothetical protein
VRTWILLTAHENHRVSPLLIVVDGQLDDEHVDAVGLRGALLVVLGTAGPDEVTGNVFTDSSINHTSLIW